MSVLRLGRVVYSVDALNSSPPPDDSTFYLPRLRERRVATVGQREHVRSRILATTLEEPRSYRNHLPYLPLDVSGDGNLPSKMIGPAGERLEGVWDSYEG